MIEIVMMLAAKDVNPLLEFVKANKSGLDLQFYEQPGKGRAQILPGIYMNINYGNSSKMGLLKMMFMRLIMMN